MVAVGFATRTRTYTLTAGQTGPFDFPFPLYAAADLMVMRYRGGGEAELVLDIDYTVSITGSGAASTAQVMLTVGGDDDDIVVLDGRIDPARGTNLVPTNAHDTDVYNEEFNRLTIGLQEVRRDVDRSFRTTGAEDGSPSLTVPLDSAGKHLARDANGNLIAEDGGGSGSGGGLTFPVGIEYGGTGAANAPTALANLGGIDVDEVAPEMADQFAADPQSWRDQLQLKALATRDDVGRDQIALDFLNELEQPFSSADTRVALIGQSNGHSGDGYQVAVTADQRVLFFGNLATIGLLPSGRRYAPFEFAPPWAATVKVEAVYYGQNYFLVQTNEATGNLYSVGMSDDGQGGHGSTDTVTALKRIDALSDVKVSKVKTEASRVNGECFWFAITTDAELYSCGYSGAQHVMGYNNTANLLAPRKMTEADGVTALSNVVDVICDTAFAPIWSLHSTNKARRWGAGTSGAHGNNDTSVMTWPEALETSHGSGIDRADIAKIAVTGASSSGVRAVTWLLTTAGKIEAAGSQLNGTGDGAPLGGTNALTFQPMAGAIDGKVITGIFAGGGRSATCLAIDSEKNGWLAGYATNGLVGDGSTSNRNVFLLLSSLPSGFSGALTTAVIAGGNEQAAIYLEANVSGVRRLATIGHDTNYETARGETAVAAASKTWGLVVGTVGTISDWAVFGTYNAYNLAILNSDGELRVAGVDDDAQTGTQQATLDVPTLQIVKTGLPRPGPRGVNAGSSLSAIIFEFDGGGAPLLPGRQARVHVPVAGVIKQATLISDVTGSIVIDVWKDDIANYPPDASDTIAASAKPTLSSENNSTDAVLSGWSTAVAADDVLIAHVESVATIMQATLSLTLERTEEA